MEIAILIFFAAILGVAAFVIIGVLILLYLRKRK